jgi:hypothetical protein
VGSEGVWAFPLAEQDLVTLDNIPWFARNAAVGDTFRVSADDEGVLWAKDKVSWSGNCTIRVIPFRAGPLRQQAGGARCIRAARLDDEGAEQFGMVALNVPSHADIHTQTSRT